MHQRQAIREWVVNALKNGATPVGARVFKNRMTHALREVELPAISVYTLSDTVDEVHAAPRYLIRTLTLEVVAGAQATDAVDDVLDDLAKHVERVLHADETLGGNARNAVLSTTELGVDESGRKPIGLVSLHYTITYQTSAPDADDVTLADNFATADLTFPIPDATPTSPVLHETQPVPTV